MTAGYRQAGQLTQKVTRCNLMFRVARGEMAGNRKGGYLITEGFCGAAQRIPVKHRLHAAIGFVTAGDKGHRVLTKRARQIGAFECRLVKADHHQPDTPANALDHGVGCQRCRQRDKPDIPRLAATCLAATCLVATCLAATCLATTCLAISGHIGVKHPGNGPAQPDRQILTCRQRLAGGKHLSAGRIQQRGIGIGAACIQSDNQTHHRNSQIFSVPMFSVPMFSVPMFSVPMFSLPMFSVPMFSVPCFSGFALFRLFRLITRMTIPRQAAARRCWCPSRKDSIQLAKRLPSWP